jgi:hypothetical protein
VIRPEGQRDINAERVLTRDAFDKLHVPEPVAAAGAMAIRPGSVPVYVGTTVFPDASGTPWTVIGTADGTIDAARNVAGKLERTSGSFASFAEHTQELLASPATVDGRFAVEQLLKPGPAPANATDHYWAPTPDSAPAVGEQGRAAKVRMYDVSEALQMTATAAATGTPPKRAVPTFETTWDDVLKSRSADTLRPVAVAPATADQVIALRRLIGDDRIVTSSIGVHDRNDRERVIGTNSMPGAGKAVLDNVDKTVGWFQTKAGVDILPKGTPLVMHENNPEYIANASAGVRDGVVNINEGPHDESLRQKWLHEESGKLGQIERRINKQIHDRNDTVLNHEWGHALRGLIWGEPFPDVQRAEDLTPEQSHLYIEHSMVNEAMSDLYGVAKGQKADFGIRKVGTTQNQSADLERYRALVARTPMDRMDEHFGTQLVSKPALEVAKAHGYDALAAITGAADTDIAAQMAAGTIDIVSVPTAASALYAAAARRFGEDDAGVTAMRNAWNALKVPLAPVAADAPGATRQAAAPMN